MKLFQNVHKTVCGIDQSKNKAELVFMNDHFLSKNILVMSLRMLISSVMEITPRLILYKDYLSLEEQKSFNQISNLKME
jgi:hypothetical protein